jgi:hypothetical protein
VSASAQRHGYESSTTAILVLALAQTVVRGERIAASVAWRRAMSLSLLAESLLLCIFWHMSLSLRKVGRWPASLTSPGKSDDWKVVAKS